MRAKNAPKWMGSRQQRQRGDHQTLDLAQLALPQTHATQPSRNDGSMAIAQSAHKVTAVMEPAKSV